MSASLVGSEMCIRDRCRAHRLCAPSGTWSSSCRCGASGRRAWSRSPAPVSYTHLTLPTICSV
eukprot:14946739-Alexandrium_andersonii.AAC.1